MQHTEGFAAAALLGPISLVHNGGWIVTYNFTETLLSQSAYIMTLL